MRRKLLIILIAVLVYGALNWACSGLVLPGAPLVRLRPQVVLPIVIGLVYGPLPGFITGFLGNVFGDFLTGYGLMYWDWSIGNGLLGAIPGLVRLLGIRTITTVSEFGILELFLIIANLVGAITGTLIDSLALHRMEFVDAIMNWVLPGVLTNLLFSLVLVPLLLIILKLMVMTLQTRTALITSFLLIACVLAVTTVLMWRANNSLLSLIVTGVMGGSAQELSKTAEQAISGTTIDLLRWAGLISLFVLLAGIFASVLLVRRVTAPVALLSAAAQSMEKGDITEEEIGRLSRNRGKDEVAALSRVFAKMAAEVKARETKLKKQVEELRIEIDHSKKARQVAEITETDYFQNLKQKAKEMRDKKEGRE